MVDYGVQLADVIQPLDLVGITDPAQQVANDIPWVRLAIVELGVEFRRNIVLPTLRIG